MRALLLAILLLVAPAVWEPAGTAAWAVDPEERLADPALEARARALSRELRCLVCQNQSIDDSNAPLARDLRLLVRERLSAGSSDREVLRFVTDRYGDYVRLRPPFQANTLVLWLAPVLVLGVGLVTFAGWLGRRAAVLEARPLTMEEQRRVAALLAEADERP